MLRDNYQDIGNIHHIQGGTTGVLVNDVTYVDLPHHDVSVLYTTDVGSWWDFELVDASYFLSTSDVWEGVDCSSTRGYRNFLVLKYGGKLVRNN